jgi:hypothetical protein
MVGLDLLQEMEEKMVKIRQNLKVSQYRKKICVNKGRTHIEFKAGDHVFLKVKARRSSLNMGNFSKLATCYCGPFEILERIGLVAYMLAFPVSLCIHNVFHVSLFKNYLPNANHIIYWKVIHVEPEGDFRVRPVCILDRKIKQLRNRAMELVKVQWTQYGPEDATWKREDAMWAEYPHLFEDF